MDSLNYVEPMCSEDTLKNRKLFVLEESNYICHYCGEKATCIDHKVPLSEVVDHSLSNLLPACRRCNSTKNHKEYDKFVAHIAKYGTRKGFNREPRARKIPVKSHSIDKAIFFLIAHKSEMTDKHALDLRALVNQLAV